MGRIYYTYLDKEFDDYEDAADAARQDMDFDDFKEALKDVSIKDILEALLIAKPNIYEDVVTQAEDEYFEWCITEHEEEEE